MIGKTRLGKYECLETSREHNGDTEQSLSQETTVNGTVRLMPDGQGEAERKGEY
jgi:hypothetical protein